MQAMIIGCGYVGCQLARRLDADIEILTHSPRRQAELRAAGWRVVVADLDQAATLAALNLSDAVVYYLAPPPSQGDRDPRMEAFCAQLSAGARPSRIVLISTTGVYGDCGDDWVDEYRPVNAVADRALRRVDAEQRLRNRTGELDIPLWILRVPGIYGAGRLPEERLRKALPVLAEQDSPWSNRVHVEDLVSACLAAGKGAGEPGIYNISDGHPSTMTDYFNQVAEVLNLPRPPQIDMQQAKAEMSAGMLSYLAESKRIDNRKMRRVLGVELKYPGLAEGLAASVAHRS